ncbi:MAG: biliverdin-producing heme oxygenase [Pseudomonadota bacterium]
MAIFDHTNTDLQCIPIMQQLREATADAHAAIENTPIMQSLLHGNLSRPHYISLLQRLHAFHKPLENKVDHYLHGSDLYLIWSVRHKSVWLEEDIHFFKQKTISSFSFNCLPNILSIPDLMGCIYVLEGATLGALVIRKLLIEHYGYESNSGGRYYTAYGTATQNFWKQTSELINTTVTAEHDKKACVCSAQKTFLMYSNAMTSYDF